MDESELGVADRKVWETPEFEVIETGFEATMYVYTR
jgi:coenzyme PQQ precursor peptide PqqA